MLKPNSLLTGDQARERTFEALQSHVVDLSIGESDELRIHGHVACADES